MCFKIGDIIKPKISYIYSKYYFKIKSKNDETNSYILEPLLLYNYNCCLSKDTLENWKDWQLDLIVSNNAIEDLTKFTHSSREEAEMKLVNDYELSKNYECEYNKIKLMGTSEECVWFPTPDFPIDIKKGSERKKEEGIVMDDNNIIRLYYDRKEAEIDRKYDKKIQEALKEDEIQKIVNEMNIQIETILENENRVMWNKIECNTYTEKTEKLKKQLLDEKHNEIKKLKNTLDEVEALFKLTDDYTERMKILKNYNIVDKNGRLTV